MNWPWAPHPCKKSIDWESRIDYEWFVNGNLNNLLLPLIALLLRGAAGGF